MTSITTQQSARKRPRRMARDPKPHQDAQTGSEASIAATRERAKTAPAAKGLSKNEAVLALLNRPEGATLAQMAETTGWLPHTTRAVLTSFKKKGHSITSEKIDGVRTYRATPSAGEPSTEPAASEVAANA